ncbi:MgtC/SapB family protein [Aegicerativicinus sediminis]|uniref:MgtC/SapB family protein n=1 Tax=Aegicerativicinus sediminis TaxID=2893202 RepID=UPI001E31AEEB|nr:MgtC/SapB family protein [Aegicerativicinus sediminis]
MEPSLDFSSIDTVTFIMKIGAATLSGIFIGLEREMKGKSAGLKTNTLVAVGAAIFIIISLQFENVKYVDLTRVLSQVVTGVGFLGAGAILQKKNKDKIKGLTTAATIWCCAGAGCLAAVGMYKELAILTVWVVLFNLVFGYVDTKIRPHKEA